MDGRGESISNSLSGTKLGRNFLEIDGEGTLMGFSVARVRALVKKEMKDLPKNINVSLMCLLPLVLVVLLSNMQGNNPNSQMGGFDLLVLGVNMNLVMVSTFAISMLIAEEKEKNTMRTLMLSSVTPAEFLAGKAIVMFLFAFATNIAIFFVTGMELLLLGHYVIWSIVVTIIMMEIGGIIGLIAKNQMSTSVLGVPVIFAFMLIPLLARANDGFEKIAALLPNYNLGSVLENIMLGDGYAHLSYKPFIIFAWFVLMSGAFIYTYHKNSLDK